MLFRSKMSVVNMVDRIIVVESGQIVLDEPKAVALAKLSGQTKTTKKA